MKHIRPPTRLYAPSGRLVGNGTVNAGIVTHRFDADLTSPDRVLKGNSIVHFAPVIIAGFGALSQKRPQISGNTLTRRSKGPGTLAQKKSVLSGTAVRIIAAAASVELYDQYGLPTGNYGPSNDSLFGTVAFPPGTVWWPSDMPPGMTIVPLAGGSAIITTLNVPDGTYDVNAQLRGITGNRSYLPIPITVV